MNLYEKVISSKIYFKGRIFDVARKEVELPNGSYGTRDIVEHNGAVAIIAITPEGKILIERQYRASVEEVIYELPAGKIEKDENPKIAAVRELEEETGYKAESIEYYTTLYPAAGYSSEHLRIYIATDLLKSKKNLDQDEFLEVLEMTPKEVLDLIYADKIPDCKTAGLISRYVLEHNISLK